MTSRRVPFTRLGNFYRAMMLILLTLITPRALHMARRITVSLRHLATTVERGAGSRLDLRVDIKQDDSLGAPTRAVNRMSGRLRAARSDLELRVRQQTKKLDRANAELQTKNAVRRLAEETVQIERNKLKRILGAMDDGVYIVNQQHDLEYANPALERLFGVRTHPKCYSYLYGRTDVCPWCPNDLVWQGQSIRREESLKDGKTYDLFDTPLENGDGTVAKLAILHDVTKWKQAEDEILQRNRELAAMSRRLLEIQESERQYISRELHDETGQALTALMLRLGILERDLQCGMPVADRVAELKRVVEEVLEGLHRLAIDLRPASLDHVGLVAALQQYAESMAARHSIVVDFVALGLDENRLGPQVEVTIYRIVQEALLNIVRHARATHADILIERGADQIRILVEDDGIGFDTAWAMESGRLGLVGLRERTEMLGGRLEVDSTLGVGTMVLVEVPNDDTRLDRG